MLGAAKYSMTDLRRMVGMPTISFSGEREEEELEEKRKLPVLFGPTNGKVRFESLAQYHEHREKLKEFDFSKVYADQSMYAVYYRPLESETFLFVVKDELDNEEGDEDLPAFCEKHVLAHTDPFYQECPADFLFIKVGKNGIIDKLVENYQCRAAKNPHLLSEEI